jgi:putative NIF3 family GTP cyclohydrolase 1 type 2
VLAEKQAYIRDHHLVIWRFHDLWHLRNPDGVVQGFTEALAWEKYRNPHEQFLFTIPRTSLSQLAADLKTKLGSRSIRIVGDAQMMVTKVAYAPGASGEATQVRALQRDDVEVLLAGESAEWETVEYVRDAVSEGRHKALILLGHEVSEEPGMEYCARWLRTVFPGLAVEFISAGEPFQ